MLELTLEVTLPAPFRNVLVRCDPTTVRHGLVLDTDGSTVHQLDDRLVSFVGNGHPVPPRVIVLFCHARTAAHSEAHVDDLAQRHAGTHRVWRQVIQLGVATI